MGGWGMGRGRDRLGVWDWHLHTAIFKTDNQQGFSVENENALRMNKTWQEIKAM